MKICKLTILLFVLPFSACSDDALLVSEKKQKDLVTRTVMGMSCEFESPIELGETYVGDGDEIELCDEGKYNKDLLTSIFINVPTYFTAEKVTLKLHDVIDCFEYDLWEEKLVNMDPSNYDDYTRYEKSDLPLEVYRGGEYEMWAEVEYTDTLDNIYTLTSTVIHFKLLYPTLEEIKSRFSYDFRNAWESRNNYYNQEKESFIYVEKGDMKNGKVVDRERSDFKVALDGNLEINFDMTHCEELSSDLITDDTAKFLIGFFRTHPPVEYFTKNEMRYAGLTRNEEWLNEYLPVIVYDYSGTSHNNILNKDNYYSEGDAKLYFSDDLELRRNLQFKP